MPTKSSITPKEKKGRYEISLAEFPVFHLDKRNKGPDGFLHYEDEITGKGGVKIRRDWTLYPDPKHGYPSASALDTFWALIQIWHEQGFMDRTIHFGTVSQIIKRKGSETDNQGHFDRIRRDLECLAGVQIDAENAMWDRELKAYRTIRRFKLFNKVNVYHEKPNGQGVLPFGTVEASEELFNSLQNNVLLCSFPEKFFYDLRPTEKLMAIYLDKMFSFYPVITRDITELAVQVSIFAKDIYKIKQRLITTLDGLKKAGYTSLQSYSFKKGQNGVRHIVISSTRKGQKVLPSKASQLVNNPNEIENLVSYMLDALDDKKSERYFYKVARRIRASVVQRLVGEAKLAFTDGRTTNKGKLFVHLVKEHAQSEGIEL